MDLAFRLRQFERSIVTQSQRTAWLSDMVRGVHESLEPQRVAQHVVARMASWMPLASWSLYAASDESASPELLATTQLVEGAQTALADLAAESIRECHDVFAASLQRRTRRAPARAALAWALHARGRTVGALVGLDAITSSALPTEQHWREAASVVLDPVALALDSALRVAHAEQLAVTDELTQLFNARYLGEALRREVKRAERGRHRLSLLFLDLDEFKGINDRWGHLVGSRALVEFGRVVRRSVRESDVVARFGGDEFAVILPDTPRLGALAVAERVRDRVRRHRFSVNNATNLRLAVSIGAASLTASVKTAEGLLQAADAAMYRAKDEGGNRVCAAPSGRTARTATPTRRARAGAGEERRR